MFIQIYKWLTSMFYIEDSSSYYVQKEDIKLPEFDLMTKAEIAEWAKDAYGVHISVHMTKSKMIDKVMALVNG
jgi:hypothetical protein